MREQVILNQSLKDEALRNVNRLLQRDKVFIYVEQFLADYTPGIAFESFLVSNVLIKSDHMRVHPYLVKMMRPDFKEYLSFFLDSLYAIFDFYLCETPPHTPQLAGYRHYILQPEAAYLFL